jgi:hypothetical protein
MVGEEACDEEFEPEAATTRFYDMFEAADMNATDGSCPEGYTSLNAQPGGAECLKLIPGMEKYASRFEFRRCALPSCLPLPVILPLPCSESQSLSCGILRDQQWTKLLVESVGGCYDDPGFPFFVDFRMAIHWMLSLSKLQRVRLDAWHQVHVTVHGCDAAWRA